MVVIKKQQIKAYILLESLVTLSIFALITSLFLFAVEQGRSQQTADYKQQEILQLAKMVVETNQDSLALNGVEVSVKKEANKISVFADGKEVIHVEKE